MREWMRLIVVGSVVLAGCAAQEIAPPAPPEVTSETKSAPDRVETTQTITVNAVVTAIDQKKRLVTLKGSDGEERIIQVSDEVRNLPQVKKGDVVVVSFYESIVFQLRKKGEAQPGAAMVEGAGRAEPGEQPGAAGARAITITATVVKIDKKAPSLTLKGPEGNTRTLPVKDASKLDPIKIGDLIEITYTEAVAIAVEKPGATK